MSAWDVYWLMQLDSILSVTSHLSFIFTFFGVIGYTAFRVSSSYADDGDADAKAFASIAWVAKPVLFVGLLSIVAQALLPSSKTAAAMIVLPAITSDSVVQTVAPEVRELYELAKDALRGLSDKDAEPKPE